MSISKVNSKFKIIRKPDYSRKDSEPSIKVEVSNKDSGLNNKSFNDLIFNSKEYEKKEDSKKKKSQPKERTNSQKSQTEDSNTSDINTIRSVTDFYI